MFRKSVGWSLAAVLLWTGLGIQAAGGACPRCKARQGGSDSKVSGLGSNWQKFKNRPCRGSLYAAAAPRNWLFYNYYVGGSACGDVPAQLYLCPRPTPPVVGHTYITYEPLMPHEFLYRHHKNYYRYDRSWLLPTNWTTVWWW